MRKLFKRIASFFESKAIEIMLNKAETEYKNAVSDAERVHKVTTGLLMYVKNRGTDLGSVFKRPNPDDILWLVKEQPQKAEKLLKFIHSVYTVNELKLKIK